MRVVAVNTYLGGFSIGLQQAEHDLVACYEPWKPGAKGAAELGLPVTTLKSFAETRGADLVIGNPPCTRFSPQVASHFNKAEKVHLRSSLSEFPELLEVLDTAIANKVRACWWETGPLAWKMGDDLVQAGAAYLEAGLKTTVTAIMIRIDLRYLGVPQHRPRCHLFYLVGDHDLTGFSLPPSAWSPSVGTLGRFIESQITGLRLNVPVALPGYALTDYATAMDWYVDKRPVLKYIAGFPKLSDPEDYWSTPVLGATNFIWERANRFWDLAEYAALMTFPVEPVQRQLTTRPAMSRTLLSKGVAPAVATWLTQWFLNPLVDEGVSYESLGKPNGNLPTRTSWGWRYDCDVSHNAQARRINKRSSSWLPPAPPR